MTIYSRIRLNTRAEQTRKPRPVIDAIDGYGCRDWTDVLIANIGLTLLRRCDIAASYRSGDRVAILCERGHRAALEDRD